ncbi:ESX-1 secretion-associated protein [Mycolicibacterium celeriflavum]|uniref:ESX-1 secretion-associated protein n=1 Tax=Mycolicibacterium celeriflavum TaxID=1249101 RepID=UPI003CF476AC
MSQLFTQTDALRSSAGIHDRVAAELSQVTGAPVAGVGSSHGQIASAVDAALSSALDARLDTMRGAADSGSTISDLLRRAAELYEQGDREGAEKLRAAAEELGGQRDTPNIAASDGIGSGLGAPGGGDPGATGNQMVGQVLGQIGQQVGALAGAVTTPLLGLAQGLQQVPQQIMQGLQGASTPARDDEKRRDRTPEDTEERSDEDVEKPQGPTPRVEPSVQAAPRGDAPGRAPVPPVAAEPPRPAQTRPQMG